MKNLWVFDFDGTLSAIIADRHAAALHPACRAMLVRLAATQGAFTAILSSRTLEDLARRIDLGGIALGGNSGAEWLLPDGRRVCRIPEHEGRLNEVRTAVFKQLKPLGEIEGLDIEDKKTSLAVHVRRVPDSHRGFVRQQLALLESKPDLAVSVYPGPQAYEIVLLPEARKPAGLKALCRAIGFQPGHGRLLYAGDDAHDGQVMKCVLLEGGTAITVGPDPLAPGALAVADPQALAHEVLRLLQMT